MTPKRWRQVTGMFHAAIARPAAERARFLDDTCEGDLELRAEVGAMLAAHEGAADAESVPLFTKAAERGELEAGAEVGPYKILSLIGAGGMGRVYRARDARLDRDVAIKVLPARYAADDDRLRRFEQEARASAALTHPNLVTVHDVGTDDGRPYLVTELVDGETLRDRLERGPLLPPRAREMAASLARGLAAAHARGVVHRDLKPENVMITRDGRVKILDFGVAKLRLPEGHTDRAPDALKVQTESGVIVGTAGYTAPEQIRGIEADGRADVFALGAILFELLTGRRAFERPTRAETLEATLREKDADGRSQSAADLAFAIEAAAATTPSQATGKPTVRFSTTIMIAAAGLFLAVGASVVTLLQ